MSKNKKLIDYIRPYKLAFALFAVCVLFTSGAVLAIGKGLGFFIDRGIASGNQEVLLESLLILFFIIVFLALAMFGRFFLITYFGERVINDIRRDLFNHLISLTPEFFEKNKVGELLSRITNDLAVLQTVLSSSISIFLRNSLMFFGCLAILISLDAKLTLTVFALIPVVVLPLLFLGKSLRKLSKLSQDRLAEVSSTMEEHISFVKLIQSYNNEEYAKSKFLAAVNSALTVARLRILLRSILTITIVIIVFSGVAVILYQGGSLVFAGKLSAGQFSSFLFYTILMAGSFAAMTEVFGSVQKARGATERLFELLKVEPAIKDGSESLDGFESLEFKDVSFCYPSRSENSLEKLNFKIKPNETIALVGSSGSGKTTILELLQRFYEVGKGKILVNGKDIKKYKLSELRKLFALVPQDSFLFSTTVKENLLFAKTSATKKELEEVAKLASADGFINKLPKKFNSYLGEKGVRISSGEKQRLALARGFLKDAEIILLDEPTSNLDSENEKYLQKILKDKKQNKTIIIIAHRLSTIRHADRIIVLDEGKIVETGTHAELSKKKGVYKKLVDLQFND